MTQSRPAGNFPRYLAGSWNFAHDHPGSAEHFFFPATLKNARKCFIGAVLYCSCLLFCILQVMFVGCPWLQHNRQRQNQVTQLIQ